MTEPFLAEIRIFPFNYFPRGWAFCDGQVLPIAQNTALFSLLGTTYGGNGRTTFALPDLQGAAPMHPGQGPGLSPRELGETGGSPTVTLPKRQSRGTATRSTSPGARAKRTTPPASTGPGRPSAPTAATSPAWWRWRPKPSRPPAGARR